MKFSTRAAVVATLAVGLVPLTGPATSAFAAPAKKPAAQANTAQPNPLGLSQTQIKKLDAIRAKAQAEATAVRKGKGTEQEKSQKIMAIAKRADAQAAAVLTPAQKKKVEQAQATQQAAMKKMQANNQAVMKSLTPAQKKKLETIQASFQKKLAALQGNTKLNDQQKQQQARNLFVQMDKQVKSVLTAKQKAMLDR